MLRLPQFQLRQAADLAEAIQMLATEGAAEGRARAVAGGTDLYPNMKRRHQTPEVVISLGRVPELRGIVGNGEVTVGATTSLAEVADNPEIRHRYPALARAVGSISSPPLRNMGTLGGNLCLDTRCTYYNQTEEWRRSIDYCMKEAGKICWVAPSSPRCWAHSASDSAPMLAALKGRVRLLSKDGERLLAVEELFRDDGIDYLTKRPDELLTQVLLPADSDADTCRSAFWKLRRRGSVDFAVLSVAAVLWTDGEGVVQQARIFLGAVASRPTPADEAARSLVGGALTPETIAHAAQLARKVATPMDNTDFQAQWRGKMVERYTEAALREAAGLPVERLGPRHL